MGRVEKHFGCRESHRGLYGPRHAGVDDDETITTQLLRGNYLRAIYTWHKGTRAGNPDQQSDK